MDISLQGYAQKPVTFLTSTADLVEGEPVIMDSNLTVKRATTGQFIIGLCSNVNGSYASIILNGAVEATYSGTAPLIGSSALCCDGSGGVKTDSDPLFYYKVLNVDTANNKITFIL